MTMITDDYARTLNPGFCAILSATLLGGTATRPDRQSPGLHLVAPYLLLPLVLNDDTARRLANSNAHGLQEFLHQQPSVIVGFAHRTRVLVPHVRAGLAYALQRGALEFDPNTHRLLPTRTLDGEGRRIEELLGKENAVAIKASRKLGRWATAITFAYVCTLLSCKPTLGGIAVT